MTSTFAFSDEDIGMERSEPTGCPCCGCICGGQPVEPPPARPRGRRGRTREERLDQLLVAVLRVIAAHPGERIRPILHRLSIRSENHGRLKYWGLVTGSAGYYQATPLGRDFLAGRVRVPASVVVQHDEVVEEGEAMVGVGELG